MSSEGLREYLAGLDADTREVAKAALRLHLYRTSPEAWARLQLGVTLDDWQKKLVQTPPGGRTICLLSRQQGKTTAAAIATAHHMLYGPTGSTSLALAPTLRQSGELIRRVRGFLIKGGGKLAADNSFSLQLDRGSRVLAMPGHDDSSIRGLSIEGVMTVDEAARVPDHILKPPPPNRTLRTSKVDDWQILAEEMQSFDQHVRASGSLALGAQAGKHDERPTSLALLVFALRWLGGVARSRHTKAGRLLSEGLDLRWK